MSVESIGRVLNHSRAKGTAKLVLVGIANHDGDGGAWPSIATLMRYANADRRTVQRAIASLVDLGEVVVHDQDGGTRNTRNDQRPNRYTITVTERASGNGAASAPPRGGAASMTGRGGTCDANGAAPTPPEPSLNHPEPSKEHSSAEPTASDDVAAAFDAFWSAYPRKVGKAAARKAWDKAVRRASVHLVAAGAVRLRDDPNLPEERFIPHASTWLNRDGWEDAPYPVRNGPATTTARVSQAMDVARRLADQQDGGAWGNVRAIGGGR